jgi:hypothetical protein
MRLRYNKRNEPLTADSAATSHGLYWRGPLSSNSAAPDSSAIVRYLMHLKCGHASEFALRIQCHALSLSMSRIGDSVEVRPYSGADLLLVEQKHGIQHSCRSLTIVGIELG